jgi:probable HAF family extracellular repeat protein
MPPRCNLVRSLPFLVATSALACQGDDLIEPSAGTLEITTSTAGAEPDADGYTVQLDSEPAQSIAVAATVQNNNVAPGTHTVHLADLAPNCTVAAGNQRAVTVTAGETTTVTFEVTCNTTTGSVQVSSATSGSSSDPDGYIVDLDGIERGVLGPTDELSLDRVAPGGHTVTLGGLAPNCSVEGENPRRIAVTASQQSTASFAVRCVIVPAYRMIDLGTLGLRDSRAYAISQEGVIVGESQAVRTPPTGGVDLRSAFIWQNGVMTGLEGPPNFDNSLNGARAVNSRRQVAGFVQTDGGETNAFLWDGDLKINLGALGCRDEHAVAYGINDAGQVVGTTWVCDENGPGPENGFVWDGRQMIDLTPGEYFSAAHAINSAGQIVGSRSGHAFLWGSAGATDLGTLGGTSSIAHAINAAGQIVGSSGTPGTDYAGGPDHAFLWENGVMTDLGTLGGEYSIAYGINAAHQVVGTSNRTAGGPPRAFFWENGIMKDLGAMAGDSSGAQAINEAGQVVGWSATPDGGVHATLWTPQ